MSERQEIKMLEKIEIIIPLERFISNQLPNVLMGIRLVEQIENFPEPTEEERKLQLYLKLSKQHGITQSKKLFKKWIFLKGFEELYQTIRETLELIWVYNKIQINDPDNLEKLKERAGYIKYPKLINEIETMTGKKFFHRKELDSLNNARNCLIHANGLVSHLYCNNDEKNALIICASKILLFWQNGIQKVPMEIGKPSPMNTPLMMGAERFQIKFSIGNFIELSLNEFVDIISFCFLFKSEIELINSEKITEKEK